MKTHLSFKHLLFIGGAVLYSMHISAVKNPVDYVSTLVGTQSKFELSTGNTYPATALPWGMNFWTPQTGKRNRYLQATCPQLQERLPTGTQTDGR